MSDNSSLKCPATHNTQYFWQLKTIDSLYTLNNSQEWEDCPSNYIYASWLWLNFANSAKRVRYFIKVIFQYATSNILLIP